MGQGKPVPTRNHAMRRCRFATGFHSRAYPAMLDEVTIRRRVQRLDTKRRGGQVAGGPNLNPGRALHKRSEAST